MADMKNVALRGVQFLFSVILVAMLGNVINENINGRMGAINYALFAAIVGWAASTIGLGAAFVGFLQGDLFVWVLALFDAASVLFVLIAGIVLPAKLGTSCSNVQNHNSNWIAYGSDHTHKRCRLIQASTAFLWFQWALLVASLVLGFSVFSRGRGGSRTGGSMSQIGKV